VKRIGMGTFVTLLVLGLVSAIGVTTASAAPAQDGGVIVCVPPVSSDYPPVPGSTALEPLTLTRGHFTPGGTVNNSIDIDGARTGVYCGRGFSTEFRLPNTTANAAGRLHYEGFAVPADFELNAMHHIDIYKLSVKVGNFDFCVDKKGDIAPVSVCKAAASKPDKPAGNLPKTGNDHLMDLLRAALVILGVGGGALYLRRRQVAARPA
jgi:LPXTG-motif cell wall-anchored protein